MSSHAQIAMNASATLEQMLKLLDARGSGLNQYLNTIPIELPDEIERKARFIASVRNTIGHNPGGRIRDLRAFREAFDTCAPYFYSEVSKSASKEFHNYFWNIKSLSDFETKDRRSIQESFHLISKYENRTSEFNLNDPDSLATKLAELRELVSGVKKSIGIIKLKNAARNRYSDYPNISKTTIETSEDISTSNIESKNDEIKYEYFNESNSDNIVDEHDDSLIQTNDMKSHTIRNCMRFIFSLYLTTGFFMLVYSFKNGWIH